MCRKRADVAGSNARLLECGRFSIVIQVSIWSVMSFGLAAPLASAGARLYRYIDGTEHASHRATARACLSRHEEAPPPSPNWSARAVRALSVSDSSGVGSRKRGGRPSERAWNFKEGITTCATLKRPVKSSRMERHRISSFIRAAVMSSEQDEDAAS